MLQSAGPNIKLINNIPGNNKKIYYCCGLSTTTTEYSCPSVCVCLSACVHDNSKNNSLIHLKLEHIVVYENSSEEFDIGHCAIKVKVTA